MKGLVSYWWYGNTDRGLFMTGAVCLAIASVANLYLAPWIERNGFLFFIFIVLALVIVFAAMVVIYSGYGEVKFIINGIRFHRIFGFWPPTTVMGKKKTQKAVDGKLKEMTLNLGVMYKAKDKLEEMLAIEINPVKITDLEKGLRKIGRNIELARKEFYAARDIAKEAEIQVVTDNSYKYYSELQLA